MSIQENYPLSQLTTFHIGGPADYFVRVASREELTSALDFAKQKQLPVLILGGGSNVLISDAGFKGLVIEIALKGILIAEETDANVLVDVAAGEIWDDVAAFAAERGLWGIENMSHVPGKAGAVPVQNVGCYGQEASDVVEAVEVLDLANQEIKKISKEELGFAYRTSRFNQEWKNKFVILKVTFRLSKQPRPNLSYIDLKKYFDVQNQFSPSLAEIREALREIRGNKFPKISEMGSDGSFFKNLLLTREQVSALDDQIRKNFDLEIFSRYEAVKNKFPVKDAVKIPAAFLIDICGLKGKVVGGARLWEKQPLVIVNAQDAKAAEVLELFNQVKAEVLAKTGIELQPEPEFVGF